MHRKLIDQLKEWKKEANKPCILVKGARQVGKTYAIERFSKENYSNYLYVNFEIYPEYTSIFDGNLDFKTLTRSLEVTFPQVRLEPYKTCIFFDEIQACPNARTALKTFALDGTLDVIASGSLLGLTYKDVSSYPVGYERVIEMYSMDFEEYLYAFGVKPDIVAYTKECFNSKKPLDQPVLERLNEYFKWFIITGGMPKPVHSFALNNSFAQTLQLQKDILTGYLHDAMKYAPRADKQKIEKCFTSLPAQLAKKNKKFMYADIDNSPTQKTAGYRTYASSLDWLHDAGIVHYCHNLNKPALPLSMNTRGDCFKIYVHDTGLLLAMLEHGVQKAILDNNLYINNGGIIENACAEAFAKNGKKLTYFERKSKLEIDFVFNLDGTSTAIKVKSGNNLQSKSLDSIIENYKTVTRYIKLEQNSNIHIDNKGVEHYPLFCAMFL